jgi:putative transcriptional regulator
VVRPQKVLNRKNPNFKTCTVNTLTKKGSNAMLRFNLRGLLQEYESRTGIHLSYEETAQITKLSLDTIKSLANRPNYNATFSTISKIAETLGSNPVHYLVFSAENNTNGTKK